MDATLMPEPFERLLTSRDGYPIVATVFPAASGSERARLIVAGATGVPQGFYKRFAEFAASQGFTTLTLDYRGVGKSKPKHLKNFHMGYLDWAYLDLAAAVDNMHSESVPLFMVGHSFGGHALGLLPNQHHIQAFYCFGSGAGWAGWMPRLERWRVQFMWNVFLPLLVASKGYLAWKRLGMGEDLPYGVYKQWKHWCRFQHYFFDDPLMAHVAGQFERVTMPMVAATSLDDAWATPDSVRAFMKGYRNAQLSLQRIVPDEKIGPIGHMGYFRPQAKPIWEAMLTWFDGQLPKVSGAMPEDPELTASVPKPV